MVVALRTPQPQPKKRISSRLGHIFQDRPPLHCSIALVVLIDPVSPVPCRRQSFRVVWIDLVPSQLLHHKPVVRLVAVERLNDVVAVTPRIRAVGVLLVPIRLGIPHQIEPGPSHLLAVTWTSEQLINQRFVSRIRGVRQEGVHHLWAGRQPRQIECDSPRQRHPIGLGSRFQLSFFQLCENETIDLCPAPGIALNLGRHDPLHRLKGPVTPIFLTDLSPRGAGWSHLFTRWPRGTHLDPPGQVLDLLLRQLTVGRHL